MGGWEDGLFYEVWWGGEGGIILRLWDRAGEIHGTFCEGEFSLVAVGEGGRGYPWDERYRKGKGAGGDVRLERGLDSEMDSGRREREKVIKKNNWGDKESVAACFTEAAAY